MSPSQDQEPIAIVGSGCRLPGGASSPSALWNLLENPRDVCNEIPSSRFSVDGFYHRDGTHHGLTNVRHAYLMQEDPRVFDSAFFNISPNEADSIDPQQRILLETVYEALESGGHTIEGLKGSDTAVYVGTMGVDYNDTLLRDVNTIPTYFATGTNRAIISNRVSYFYDWHGPSMTIDTACSSSLIAVHQAVQSLRSKESRVAVACGTQIILGPEVFIFESKMKMLSPTGRSRMWDVNADGYARGEGVAAVVLKKLSDAIADGDHIQALIRETGANQDGYSNGITVPSTKAQAALIRQTYARAGLDLSDSRNHPQFFEAHGTGTQAGDPKEAAAIHESLGSQRDPSDPLYVGSIKTVIGHTEGTAGLAGLLKGIKSIEHGYIAPNLLFNTLNPKVEPFIAGLKVPTSLTPWPQLPDGVPRRVSVNSFGFGGSNAHAILESAPFLNTIKTSTARGIEPVAPFVFSAMSEASLIDQLQAYSDHLDTFFDTDPVDLSWTLRSRRSIFPFKAAFAAKTIPELANKLKEAVGQSKEKPVGIRSKASELPKILGVFTGQGAQWAAMGAEFIESSEFVAQRVQELEHALNQLPAEDRPDWSLREELLAGPERSRLAEAKIAQPLCTALQIVLVDLLAASGIGFAAVVGHSSGEIAAAYAAGFLSATDAIVTAYLRGVYAQLAGNDATGQKGAMMAVGTDLEDAKALIGLRTFRDRIAIAAHNSGASVTLSGDVDAIVHAKKVFDEEKKFARLLKVDTAYHSHHMAPCGPEYIAALQRCGVKVRKERASSCSWFSSVTGDGEPMTSVDELQDLYWRDNMTGTVRFADALTNAARAEPELAFAFEVGPHPALQGPAIQNIAEVRSTPIPYSGVLSRGKSDISSFASALGKAWTYLGPQTVDLNSYEKTVLPKLDSHRLVTDLPAYRWSHNKSSLFESRKSRKTLGRKQAHHEILGVLSPDSTSREKRWNNVLKVSEIPWLEGHQLQGQSVFPAAGYVALAIEAARTLADRQSIELIELFDLTIPRAITFEEDSSAGVETMVTLTNIRLDEVSSVIDADFSCYSCPANGTDVEMELMSSGSIQLTRGAPSMEALPATKMDDSNMADVDEDRFYASLEKLSYGYSGSFRTISNAKRGFNSSSVTVDSFPYNDEDATHYLVHPTWLDVAFQASMLAYSAPGDERLWSLHVPTNIGKISVNPAVCASLPTSKIGPLSVTSSLPDTQTFSASIDIFNKDEQALVQVEALTIKPFAPATAADDRRLFSYTKWDLAEPDGTPLVTGITPTTEEVELAAVCERVSYYYIRRWKTEISDEDWAKGQPHHAALRDYMNHMYQLASTGRHPTIKKSWGADTASDIKAITDLYPKDIDLLLIKAVGENIPAAVRGDTTILEHMLPDNMLDDYYKYGLGFARYNTFLAGMMEQIVHRYPHAKILEIGAGTGGATKAIFDRIGGRWSSYTYTDVSVGFFEKAGQLFKTYSDRMIFKVLDVEKSPSSQGYEKHSYDIVVASNVLHATQSLQKTLEHVRQILKPGGYLMLLELTNNGPVRFSNIMGGLSGWWAGVDDKPARKYAPTVTPGEWQTALRKAGFSGIDAITPEVDGKTWPFSIMAAQAANEQTSFLRRPLALSKTNATVHIESLVILGGDSYETSRIWEEVEQHLSRFCGEITTLSGLPTEEEAESLSPMSTFLILADLEKPIFEHMTQEKMDGLRRVYELASHILWVTAGGINGLQPYHSSSIAFSRAMSHENAHISMNHLDFSELSDSSAKAIAEHLLRHFALDNWENSSSMFWSKEPEVYVDGAQHKVGRLVDHVDQNQRLNASRRIIRKKVPAISPEVAVDIDEDDKPTLVPVIHSSEEQHGETQLIVDESSVSALKVGVDAFLIISKGHDSRTATECVAVSTTNARELTPVATIPAPQGVSLVSLVAQFLALAAVASVPEGSSLLTHGSHADHAHLIDALRSSAASRRIQLTITCDASDQNADPAWIRVNGRTPRIAIARQLTSAKVTHFLDLTSDSKNVASRIAEAISPKHKRIFLEDLVKSQPAYASTATSADIAATLQRAVTQALALPAFDEQALTVKLGDISKLPEHKLPVSTIKWSVEGEVDVAIRPLSGAHLFSPDKSYLLVGLSGQIGRSLCEWMVQNGAGCVVLTSRNPKVNKSWLESVQGGGAIVKVVAADVTDRNSLQTVIDDIRATCPPVAGVANGAMVLVDTLFSKMSAETMQAVLGPKIDGSNNLDAIFYDDPLDFFVLFSSSACIIGNSGQSNYAAANGYLSGLARQRRRRGLACSVMDIGRVAGIGYVETAGQAVLDQLTRFGLMAISEAEFRQMFAETILAGLTDANAVRGFADCVVTTGIRKIRDDEEIQGPWFDNPRFAHCIVETKSVNTQAGATGKKGSAPVAEQLAGATSTDEAVAILEECFMNRLRIILQLGDAEVDLESPLVELGVDSLVAVEVRSWFLKELKVDIPVLKIVGGASPAELCQRAIEKLPEDVLANLGGEKQVGAPPSKTTSPPVTLLTTAPESAPPEASKSDSGSTTPSSARSSSPSTEASRSSTPLSTPASVMDNPLDAERKASEPKPSGAKRPLKFLKSGLMSFAQSRFWFLRLLLEDQTTSNVAFYYHISGALRVGDLERAVRVVTLRHESLRTAFVEDDNSPDQAYQKVMPSSPLRLEQVDVKSLDEVKQAYDRLQRETSFDLDTGFLFRLVLCTLTPTSHYLLVNYHHILMDGVSFQIFLADLEKAYQGQSLGKPPGQYLAHSTTQRAAYESGALKSELDYWRTVFPVGEEPPVLPLLPMASKTTRVAMKSFGVHQVGRHIPSEVFARVKAIARSSHCTPMHFYLAAFKEMLFRFTGAEDLTIGIADANRQSSEVMNSIGFFLNLLVLRFRRHKEQSFSKAITEARDTAYSALANSSVPFDILLQELNVARSSTHSPFFQAFFDYRQGAQEKHSWADVEFEFQEVHPGRTAYDITLDVTDGVDESLVMFRAQRGLYDESATTLLLDTFIHFVDVLSRDASVQVDSIPRFGERQLSQATSIGRGPTLTAEWSTLPHRIDDVCRSSRDMLALVDGIGPNLTYGNMLERIQAISEALQEAGTEESSRVLVYQTASSQWICSMLAIMRLGAIYVPLDLRNPIPRLSSVAQDAEAKAILVDGTTYDSVGQLDIPGAAVIDIRHVPDVPTTPVDNVSKSGAPAAILYTSGSTGLPKGIIVTHAGLRNEIEGYTKQWGLGAEKTLQQSAYTFNHSSDQIYTGLVNGGTVCTVPWDKRGDPREVTLYMRKYGVTYTKATPSEYSLWVQFGRENLVQCSQWQRAFGGGEVLTQSTLDEFASLELANLRFFNSYGPTEISISSTKMEIDYRAPRSSELTRIPCGFSLPNYYKYIVDENMQPLPAGMAGELCIGGAGVSLGYYKNEDLTSKHFLTNPFATSEDVAQGWDRIYRTGDICHLQQDGAMVFHSRISGDSQVKIRGLRIELADIESNIVQSSSGRVKEAVVTLRTGDPDFLVAHVVFTSGHKGMSDKDTYLAELLAKLPLPQYMIPVAAFSLDSFPLSNHAKVDRKAVQQIALPERKQIAGGYSHSALTATAKQLRTLWQDVIGNKNLHFDINASTSFFAIGGNSLLAIRLQSQIRQMFNVTLRLVDILSADQLSAMARKIEEGASVSTIDWDVETAPPQVPAFIQNYENKSTTSPEGKIVLLTGATGFLGKYILPLLLDRADVARVHCLAVRETASRSIPAHPKIIQHTGDLSLPLLGLNRDTFRDLAHEADVIFHMGAARSFWDNYHVLRPINVQPTKELVKLAAPRKIPIHYISSFGVLGTDATRLETRSAADNVPDADGTEGYTATRWASERILERSAAELGIPSYVYRYLPSTAETTPQDVLDDFVHWVDESGLMPDMDGWEGRIDMAPAQETAVQFVQALLANGTKGATTQFSHCASPIKVDVAEMRQHIERARGAHGLDRLPGLQWIGRIKKLGWGYLLTSQQASVGGKEDAVFKSRR